MLALLLGIAIDRGAIVLWIRSSPTSFPSCRTRHRSLGANALGDAPGHHSGRMGGQVDPHAAHTRDRRARPADGLRGGQGLPVRQCISHLFGIAVVHATGMSPESFADAHLLQPVGIERYI